MARALSLAVVILLWGCTEWPARPPRVEQHRGVASLRAEGDVRFAAGEWEAAIQAYRAVVERQPDAFTVRYRLGVALAALDRVDEAASEFERVVERGTSDREEVRIAQRWLRQVRQLEAAEPTAEPAVAPVEPGDLGKVQGTTEWANLDPSRPMPRLMILLDGAEASTRGKRYWVKVELTRPYQITGVVPGRYRLSAHVGQMRLWDSTVEVKSGVPTVVDLTQSTSIAPPGIVTGLSGPA